MTYIEFFDTLATENLGASLTNEFDRLIFIGDKIHIMKSQVKNYEDLLKKKNDKLIIEFEEVPLGDAVTAEEVITRIVTTHENCVFDLTGGDTVLALALGIVKGKHPDINIQIQKVNLKRNIVFDCDLDGETVSRITPSLLVEQHIKAYGGDVVYGKVDDYNKTYRWALDEEFLNDFNEMWAICKQDPSAWNAQMGVFASIEKFGTVQDGVTTTAQKARVERYLKENDSEIKNIKKITKALLSKGLLIDLDLQDNNLLSVTYKSKRIKRCLVTAGQMLEMLVFITAKQLRDKQGKLIYDDALNGVVIDWDGKIHTTPPDSLYETKNEIDVFLMHDMIPVFISCKSGKIKSEELYKLDSVAEHFGGKYAKRVLIATALDDKKNDGESIRKRAADMGIRLIEKKECFDPVKLAKCLAEVWDK